MLNKSVEDKTLAIMIIQIFSLSAAVRALDNYNAILNTTFPCVDMSKFSFKFRHVDLSEEELADMLVNSGGNIMPGISARNEQEADLTFVNLLSDYTADYLQTLTNVPPDGPVNTKQEYLRYLDKISMYHPKSDRLINNHAKSSVKTRPERSTQHKHYHLKQSQQHLTDKQYNQQHTRHRPVLPLRRNYSVTFNKEDSSVSTQEACTLRGAKLPWGDFSYMCSRCLSIKKLPPEDNFPYLFNELTCRKNDLDCLEVAGVAFGQCHPISYPVKILRRNSEMCTLFLRSNERLVVAKWEPIDIKIQTGCQCLRYL